MIRFLIVTAVIFGVFYGSAQPRAEKNKAPVIVELFTSQSCSSCPPADQFLNELSNWDNVITLGCHVTYWDHLRWKDTLGLEYCTKRQKAMALVKNSSRVYTPQMVVNGQEEFVGSKKRTARSVISKAQIKGDVTPIHLTRMSDGVMIAFPALKKRGDYTLWLMGYQKDKLETIPSGENRGKSVRYKNAVRSIQKLGKWSGNMKSMTVAMPKDSDIGGYAILAQKNGFGAITAVGKLDF